MKNILILNAGTRNMLIQYFKQECKKEAQIIVTDSYELAPALYEADKGYVTKRWDETGYWDEIDEICDKENIGLILSLIDPELELLATQQRRFEKKGIIVNIGNEETIKTTFDKFKTLEFIRAHDYPWIRSYISLPKAMDAIKRGELNFPVVVKPRKGSGSTGVEMVYSVERLEQIITEGSDMLIQEYMSGQEIGADVYVDLITGEVVSIFTKKKLKMRSGETDKSVSFKDEKLLLMLTKFVKEFDLKGVNDIDLFEKGGEYYISEINPRFGGGYLHAFATGVNFPKYLINNMQGIPNRAEIGLYDENIYMMKYFSIITMREDELCNL